MTLHLRRFFIPTVSPVHELSIARPEPQSTLFERIADALVSRGSAILPASLPADVAADLQARLDALDETAFRPAAIGRGRDTQKNRFVRNNRISWLDDSDRERAWDRWTESLRCHLNRELYLGLFSFESHFTRYDEGDFYRRHGDSLRGERNRVLSGVTFMNSGWLPDQGGELVLYHDDGSSTLVTPEAGTLVIFLSEEVPHEVLTTHRTRYGLAGWYRLNTNIGENLDPPR